MNCNCKKEVNVYFAAERSGVKIPTKNREDAGYDIYANFEQDYIRIPAHKTVMIPTGLVSACDEDYYFQLFERGSTGSKGMAQRCGVIDSGYRGEWFVPITNTTDHQIVIVKEEALKNQPFSEYDTIYPYEKAICQAVLLPVPKTNVVELSLEEIRNMNSMRGQGKLGSTNK